MVCPSGRLQILFCSSLWPVTSRAPLSLLLWSLMFLLHSEVADALYLVNLPCVPGPDAISAF